MKKLSIIIAILFIAQSSFSQNLNKAAAHRIGDYGKLWSVLKLFHPEMAYGRINEDSLFTEHIVELIKDPSAANFKNAVQKMISRLNDPYTAIEERKTITDSVHLPDRPLLKWVDDSIALLYFDMNFMMQNAFNRASLLHFMDTLNPARRHHYRFAKIRFE
jgi:hypothetical protein